jgi:Tol biopolymer transport system component
MTLTPERWQRARNVLHEAMEMEEEDRSAYLDSQCASDPSLRAELKELLDAEGQIDSSFLEKPAMAHASSHTHTSDQSSALPPGTKLGIYVVQSLIGAGGMGEVYRARDASLKRDVAIKVLPASVSRDPDRLRRFQLEAEAAAALNHSNILSIFAIGQQDGSPYIVTELLEGETLRERLRHGALKFRDAIDIAIQTAKGLAAAHERGIAHRDLKPENLFLAKDDRVKILDFGLAKLMQNPSADSPTISLREQTDAGRILGTVGYMSPEQVRGEPADARSDIFSLGCVLYEMLTGKRAFRRPTAAETMSAILNEDPRAASDITPTIQPALERAVHRCLEKAPERRFQSASDLAFALDALSDSSASRTSGDAQVGSRRFAIWGGGVVLLAMLALALAAGYKYHWFKKQTPASQEWEQLTDFPDAAVAPALSPDGKMLAFVRGAHVFLASGDVYVKLLPRGEPVQLTHQDKLKAEPAFSPDGSRITYTTNPPWDTWVVPVLGGPTRLMLPNASGLTWIDNRHVLFSEIKSGIHMAVVTATEGRAEQRDVYVPLAENGMAHRSYLSPDHKWVLIAEEMIAGTSVYTTPCRVVPFDGSSPGTLVGPHSACSYGGWSPDGKWMFFSAHAGDGFHLFRQAFPDGEPEQLTFGPTEQEGVAIAPDGRSVLTSVGFLLRTVWVHDQTGDHQVAFSGSARLPMVQISSRAVFSPDGSKLYFFGRQGSKEADELWQVDLLSGQSEPVLPGTSLWDTFDISPDGHLLVFDSFDAKGVPKLWTAWLDRRAPPRQLESELPESDPVFGLDGSLYYQAQEGPKSYLYRRPTDGGAGKRVTNHPVVRLQTISPDGKWLVAESPVGSEDSFRGVEAFNVDDDTVKRVCSILCIVRWSADGKLVYVSLSRSGESVSRYRTFIVPLRHGSAFPDLPATGIKTEADLEKLNGVKVVDELLHPGPDSSRYAFDRESDHRNIYRIPLPN